MVDFDTSSYKYGKYGLFYLLHLMFFSLVFVFQIPEDRSTNMDQWKQLLQALSDHHLQLVARTLSVSQAYPQR